MDSDRQNNSTNEHASSSNGTVGSQQESGGPNINASVTEALVHPPPNPGDLGHSSSLEPIHENPLPLDRRDQYGGGVGGEQEPDDVVQVVYQSDHSGAMVGVETSLLDGSTATTNQLQYNNTERAGHYNTVDTEEGGAVSAAHQQSRPTSTLPSVAEESSGGGASADYASEASFQNRAAAAAVASQNRMGQLDDEFVVYAPVVQPQQQYGIESLAEQQQLQQYYEIAHGVGAPIPAPNPPPPIYSTVSRQRSIGSGGRGVSSFGYGAVVEAENQVVQSGAGELTTNVASTADSQLPTTANLLDDGSSTLYANSSLYNQSQLSSTASEQGTIILGGGSGYGSERDDSSTLTRTVRSVSNDPRELANPSQQQQQDVEESERDEEEKEEQKENLEEDFDEEISNILARQTKGAAESGSFRNNFRKKLGISVSTNENDLIAHRQKLLQAREASDTIEVIEDEGELGSLPNKFKRTHSVSFNVGAHRAGRHSVDIRNLPSYLSVKRASIVDVAKGAMSSLMHSFGSGASSSVASSHRRDSSPDEEPIFEEPIAPTLSLGQRVALVGSSGAEFGTVGWIGQLPDVDDDWIVGVIFDNMIGNCDGAHNGVRYFYARDNYAMFVPLSTLTKTDNYIGRPETGTMLSRMSVSLKPGQLISIQRSSIRLQHCFLNAPHQRVGHDVRAVSNRLHCQCHNCGPCAHLTKQGRQTAMPPYGVHHAPNKKNSLAHAAVEILAHHHHHYHEEQHKEEDYQFGDNAAHACNFVRYSCCQQYGTPGHDFSADCGMVRPELLDNLIHAPRAPHRRSRPRRLRRQGQQQHRQQVMIAPAYGGAQLPAALELNPNSNQTTLDGAGTFKSWTTSDTTDRPPTSGGDGGSSYSSGSGSSSRSSSSSSSLLDDDDNGGGHRYTGGSQQQQAASSVYSHNDSYANVPIYQQQQQQSEAVYNTFDSRMSLMDQQRYIYQRDSSAFMQSRPSNISDDVATNYRSSSGVGGTGLGSSIRRCFACITGRKSRPVSGGGSRRPKKRKLSVRNRMIEYRRRQSTFVPSTLAKPQEDFASHGIMPLPVPSTSQQPHSGDSNSDYSSYSKSSCSSRSNSPGPQAPGSGAPTSNKPADSAAADQPSSAFRQPQSMTIEHGAPSANEIQLKSSHTFQGGISSASQQLDYDDYTFSDGYGGAGGTGESSKKQGYSCDSALTDLGYFDGWTNNNNSSSDTLKQIVDQTINEQVSLPEPNLIGQSIAAADLISPISSCNCSNPSEHIDVSSPTVSLVEQEQVEEMVANEDGDEEVCQRIGCLDLDDKQQDSSSL